LHWRALCLRRVRFSKKDALSSPTALPFFSKKKKTQTQVLLKKEGSEDAAVDALGRVMLAAHGHLAKVANGEDLFPRFHLTDPIFAHETHGLGEELEALVGKVSGKVKGKIPTKAVTKFAASKTFFNYAPCVLSESGVRLVFGF
jgi:hypothetical protein